MKRIALVTILAVIALIMTGCAKRAETSSETSIAHAQLIMPDGTIVEGVLTDSLGYDISGWMTVSIDGVKYRTNQWRIVMWEGQ